MTTARTRVGAVVVALYLVVFVATVRLTDHHVRPLFEGIGPAPAYQWVDPPPEFAVGNVKPHEVVRDLALTEMGTGLTSLSSGDAQVVVNIPEGAVPPHAGDTKVNITFTPLSAKNIGVLPEGLRADGNVYKVALTYQPSGAAIDKLAQAGNIVMSVPEAGKKLLFSPDGRTWRAVATQPVGSPTILGTTFAQSGSYVGGTAATAAKKKSNSGTVVLAAGVVAALALALGLGPVLVRRLRKPGTRQAARRQARSKR
jgi:hypothetical protein